MDDKAELARRMGDMIRLAVVTQVDLGAARVTVRAGDLESGPIPWLSARAGKTAAWSAPSLGEQVLLLCPEGDLERGLALPGVFSRAHPAPAADGRELLLFDDGAVISYAPEAHLLTAILPAGGKIQLSAPAGVEISGDVRIAGDLVVSGDVQAGEVSLSRHVHSGVQPGAGQSEAPL